MKKKVLFKTSTNPIRFFSAALMCACLSFLVCVNFFVYPSNTKNTISWIDENRGQEEDAQGPKENKSNSNINTAVQEEYLHHNEHDKEIWLSVLFTHNQTYQPGKLEVVHFELISPPPDFS